MSEFVLEMSSVHGHKRLKTTTRFSRLSLQESTSVAVRVSKESFKVFLGFLGFIGFIGFIGFFVQRPNTTQKHIRKKNITYMVMMVRPSPSHGLQHTKLQASSITY